MHVLQDANVVRRSLAAGATLFPERGEDSFLVVVDGALAIQCHRHDGGTITLEVLGPGACVPPFQGESSLSHRMIFSALVPSSVARVPQSSFERVLLKNPSLASALGAILARQHAGLLFRLAAQAERSPSRRVAGALLYVAPKVGQRCPLAAGTRVPLAQSAVAQVAGVTRQTANRALQHLQSFGLVRTERSLLCVLDPDGLQAFTEGRIVARVWKPAGPCKLVHPDERLNCYPLRRARRGRKAEYPSRGVGQDTSVLRGAS
jgi:CRP-like cAMP-binding protein